MMMECVFGLGMTDMECTVDALLKRLCEAETTINRCHFIHAIAHAYTCISYLATLTGNTAVVIASSFVSTHHTRLILLQVAGDVAYNKKNTYLHMCTCS